MVNFINKIKSYFNQSPITAEQAKLLQQIGRIETPEERLSKFLSETDSKILDKAKFGKCHLSIEIPFDLINQTQLIITTYKNREFETTLLYDSILIIKW